MRIIRIQNSTKEEACCIGNGAVVACRRQQVQLGVIVIDVVGVVFESSWTMVDRTLVAELNINQIKLTNSRKGEILKRFACMLRHRTWAMGGPGRAWAGLDRALTKSKRARAGLSPFYGLTFIIKPAQFAKTYSNGDRIGKQSKTQVWLLVDRVSMLFWTSVANRLSLNFSSKSMSLINRP
ncbi:hypothetical protein AXF42_Ash005484 [Apostasia shenzhenica]|uniref:Uncharacterized protein n=1 Tax=Apostasia shenzhenica TaxID=1088818 RepID=A0A2I0B725_9ASPA|nr:hypothetical protein AXF42_Ash005484 [Apostasia shenzhenica]